MGFKRTGYTKLNERHFRESVKEYTIYVEGDIDRLFWQGVFPTIGEWVPRVEVLQDNKAIIGGWVNLIKYLEAEISKKSKINFIIAIDGDYNKIIHHKKQYDNVVIMEKYSLENYIFCPVSLNMCMNMLSYGIFNNVSYIEEKMQRFAEIIKPLIILDCVNVRDSLYYNLYDISGKDLNRLKSLKQYIKLLDSQYNDILVANSNILDSHKLIDFVRWKVFLKIMMHIIKIKVNAVIKSENVNRSNNQIGIIRAHRTDDLYMYCIKNCMLCSNKCSDYARLQNRATLAFNSLQLN